MLNSATDQIAAGETNNAALAGSFVEADVNYLSHTTTKPQIIIPAPGQGDPERVADYTVRTVRIHDVRPIADTLSLDVQGFDLVRHETGALDFHDEEQVRSKYYPQAEKLVLDATGAQRALIFDHTIRMDGETSGRKPVRIVHNDYTPKSGPQRVRDLLEPQEAEQRLRHRFAVINVWRPINGPVQTSPLAVADARQMTPDDFVAADLVYADRTGEIFDVAFNSNHRWFYVPAMRNDESLLLKTYDSAEDGRARFTAHTAFEDPTTPVNATPRESIETRMLIFFE